MLADRAGDGEAYRLTPVQENRPRVALGELYRGGRGQYPEDKDFKRPFSMAGAISQRRESCQFLFCLRKPTVVLGGAAGERSGGFLIPPAMRVVRDNPQGLERSHALPVGGMQRPRVLAGPRDRSNHITRRHRTLRAGERIGKLGAPLHAYCAGSKRNLVRFRSLGGASSQPHAIGAPGSRCWCSKA
jgi:hypothetical protein